MSCRHLHRALLESVYSHIDYRRLSNSYVILTATATACLGIWHGVFVSGYRKKAKIRYPNAYASAEEAKTSPTAHAFNCAQRAHGNFLENQTPFLSSLLLGGLRFPLAASALGCVWLVGRYMYAVGYANSKMEEHGKGRYQGFIFYVGQAGVIGLAGYTGISMLLGW